MKRGVAARIWIFLCLTTGLGWGVLWSLAMALVMHHQVLSILWPFGTLGGLGFGAVLASLASRELATHQVSFAGPLHERAELITSTLAKYGYDLTSETSQELAFTSRRSIAGHVPTIAVREATGGSVRAVGPRGALYRLRDVAPR